MKSMLMLSLALLTLPLSLFPQDRYLVSPGAEVIPLRPGESASAMISRLTRERMAPSSGACTDKFIFGHHPDDYPTTSNFGAYPGEVIGQWYEAPADGKIDTIFWYHFGGIGAHDSTLFIRVHESNIHSGAGPGVRPGPYNPPCQNWGYWVNTDDLHSGLSAFIDDATDTSWVSTVTGSTVPSFPPFGDELWGLGGYEKKVQPNAVNFVAMSDLADSLAVELGDAFFISMRVNQSPGPPPPEEVEERTEWAVAGFSVTTVDENYPSRNWKFYEYDKGPSNCSGMPVDSARRGWIARGGFGPDTLEVGMFNIWYSMTVTSNVPPVIDPSAFIPITFDTGPREVVVLITDCDPATPSNAGVASASIRYEVDGVPQSDIPMSPGGGDIWSAIFPGHPAGSRVIYNVLATDLGGLIAQSPPRSFYVMALSNEFYAIDTQACTPIDLTASGTVLDTMEFFPYQAAGLTGRAESGTAGPFDMGESFIAFRDSFRYAWVGVDGAVGLSKTPDDTVEIGDFLYGNPAPPGSAPYGLLFVPGTMIAPLLSERTLVDSTHQGVIRIGNNSDSCLFVVEWDSVPGRGLSGSTAPLTFQAILDRCSGQIRFQYDDAGNIAADPPGIVAVKSDSSQNTGPDPGMLLANERGAPAATRPGDRPCITLVPTIGGVVREGWNLLALSMAPAGGPELLTTLFPTAVSDAFRFFDGYVEAETLDAGTGFWLKFPKEAAVGYVGGEPVDSLTIPVVAGWNIIGGPSCPLPVGAVTPVGTDIVSSFFDYGFSKGWTHAQTLQPGIGYWVKVSGPGFLEMKCPP